MKSKIKIMLLIIIVLLIAAPWYVVYWSAVQKIAAAQQRQITHQDALSAYSTEQTIEDSRIRDALRRAQIITNAKKDEKWTDEFYNFYKGGNHDGGK